MMRPLLLLLSLGLQACATPVASAPGWRFVLSPGAEPPADAPVAVVARPALTPPPAAPAVTIAPPPAAGASSGRPRGGATEVVARVEGFVGDRDGRPLSGATVIGLDSPLTSGADGRFSAELGAGPLLTVSLPGYVSQTQGPPYRFGLEPVIKPASASFVLSGVTSPVAPGALVVYADESGAEARAVADAHGAFSLTVTPRSATPLPGVLVVTQHLTWSGSSRYRLQQASPQAGALALAGGAQAGLSVAMAPAPARLSLKAPSVPAGMRASGVELSVISPGGASAVINWSEGVWPSELPVLHLEGLTTCLTLSAQDPDATVASVVEHVVAPGETDWKPKLLEAPTIEVKKGNHGKKVRWRGAGGRTALTVFPGPQLPPSWEGVVAGSELDLPVAPDGGELEVQTWDVDDVPLPSQPQGPKGDRRYASTRVPLEPLAPASN